MIEQNMQDENMCIKKNIKIHDAHEYQNTWRKTNNGKTNDVIRQHVNGNAAYQTHGDWCSSKCDYKKQT